MEESARLRQDLVERLVTGQLLHSPRVREAFLRVPRELFVPEVARSKGLDHVYTDQAIVTHERDGVPTSSSSQPAVMALMLEALDVAPGHRVLEIGLGTGYNAALLTELTGPQGVVTSVDIDESFVDKARKVFQDNGFSVAATVADGRSGWPAGAPYDRIIATASSDIVPRQWWEQLVPSGLLVVPLRLDAMQIIAVFERTEQGFQSRKLIPGGFMPLRDPASGRALPESDSGTVVVRTMLPGQPTETIQATGPGLATLTPQALRHLIGYLILEPQRTPVPEADGVALLWFTALTSDPGRQITSYLNVAGLRFGLTDPRSGAFSTFVVERVRDRLRLTGIDSFGPDRAGAEELLGCLQRWQQAGSPAIEELAVEVSYSGAGWAAAARTVEHHDHRLHFGWR